MFKSQADSPPSYQGVTSGRGLDSFTAKTTELPPLLHPIMMIAITSTVVIFQPKPVTRRNWFLLIKQTKTTLDKSFGLFKI